MDIFAALLRPEVMVFMIPITAIVGGIYYNLQKLKYTQGLQEGEKQVLIGIKQENQEIKDRLKNLESIITSMDKELLALKSEDEQNTQRVKEISDRLK